MQSLVDQARIACALEVHYLKEGEYPENLSELGKGLPSDVFTGEPYHYVAESKQRYRIYGVGWDLKDDGGKANNQLLQKNHTEYEKLDFVIKNFTHQQIKLEKIKNYYQGEVDNPFIKKQKFSYSFGPTGILEQTQSI